MFQRTVFRILSRRIISFAGSRLLRFAILAVIAVLMASLMIDYYARFQIVSLQAFIAQYKAHILVIISLYFAYIFASFIPRQLELLEWPSKSAEPEGPENRRFYPDADNSSRPSLDLGSEEQIFSAFYTRMREESARLQFNSNKNLLFGTVFSVTAFIVLAYFMLSFEERDYTDLSYMLRFFLPRISIVLLIQFVGFFFLRLYVANELDLKHNKNEITNLESRMIAYLGSRNLTDIETRKAILMNLVGTERNFLLKKGERTISVENISEYNDLRAFIDKLLDKIPSDDHGKASSP